MRIIVGGPAGWAQRPHQVTRAELFGVDLAEIGRHLCPKQTNACVMNQGQ
jgi:hypothetical protein